MPIFPDNSVNHPDQGMTKGDISFARDVAADRNEIIMFRNTGCWSRPYIELGHPTKPFHVKGKSSDWGPQAGLVPENSEFSKAFSQEDIDKGKKANQEAIAGGYARTMPLYITEEFLHKELLIPKSSENRRPVDLIGIQYLRWDGDIAQETYIFHCTKWNDVGKKPPYKEYGFVGFKNMNGLIEVCEYTALGERDRKAKPLMVMTVPGADKPITGDYDLFAVCPSWEAYGSNSWGERWANSNVPEPWRGGALDRKMDPTLDDPRISASLERTRLKSIGPEDSIARSQALYSLSMLKAARTPEDPDRGNLTPRILEAINALVSKMGGKHPRVHHNAESGRPFAPGAEEGFPLTTFHPQLGIGGYNFRDATINDIGDLREYFNNLYASGYYPPRNRGWNMPSLNPLLPGHREPKADFLARLANLKQPGRNWPI